MPTKRAREVVHTTHIMLYASTDEGRVFIDDYVKDRHGAPRCPCCDVPLVVKRGTLVAHHFAHSTKQDCEHWTEPMTQWHAGWQLRVFPEQREIRMTKDGETHIADIQLPGGTVVEIQHSPISTAEVERREVFYEEMVWLVDGRKDVSFEGYYDGRCRRVFLMSGGRGWWFGARRKPVLVDTKEGVVVLIEKTHVHKRTIYWLGVAIGAGPWIFKHTNQEVFFWLHHYQNAIPVNDIRRIQVSTHTRRDESWLAMWGEETFTTEYYWKYEGSMALPWSFSVARSLSVVSQDRLVL